MTAVLLLGGALGIWLLERHALFAGQPRGIQLMEALCASASVRTAGFNTVDLGRFSEGTKLFHLFFMLVGGSPGSTAGGIKTSVRDGKMVIEHEGKFKKFVNQIRQSSFSARRAVADGKEVIYITERAVFEATADGLLLTEIAPGIDLQKDILDQMEFAPIIPEGGPKLMPAEIFQETWGGLKNYFYS